MQWSRCGVFRMMHCWKPWRAKGDDDRGVGCSCRKRLYSVLAESPLPGQAYRAAISEKVYAELATRARSLVRGGCRVVADAVLDCADYRRRIE